MKAMNTNSHVLRMLRDHSYKKNTYKGLLVNAVQCFSSIFCKRDTCTDMICLEGLFGCYKMTFYYGGVDEGMLFCFRLDCKYFFSVGMLHNDQNSQIFTKKGCLLLPLANNMDDCVTQPLLGPGTRVVTCYCNSDYCNGAVAVSRKAQVIMWTCLFLSLFMMHSVR